MKEGNKETQYKYYEYEEKSRKLQEVEIENQNHKDKLKKTLLHKCYWKGLRGKNKFMRNI